MVKAVPNIELISIDPSTFIEHALKLGLKALDINVENMARSGLRALVIDDVIVSVVACVRYPKNKLSKYKDLAHIKLTKKESCIIYLHTLAGSDENKKNIIKVIQQSNNAALTAWHQTAEDKLFLKGLGFVPVIVYKSTTIGTMILRKG